MARFGGGNPGAAGGCGWPTHRHHRFRLCSDQRVRSGQAPHRPLLCLDPCGARHGGCHAPCTAADRRARQRNRGPRSRAAVLRGAALQPGQRSHVDDGGLQPRHAEFRQTRPHRGRHHRCCGPLDGQDGHRHAPEWFAVHPNFHDQQGQGRIGLLHWRSHRRDGLAAFLVLPQPRRGQRVLDGGGGGGGVVVGNDDAVGLQADLADVPHSPVDDCHWGAQLHLPRQQVPSGVQAPRQQDARASAHGHQSGERDPVDQRHDGLGFRHLHFHAQPGFGGVWRRVVPEHHGRPLASASS